MKKQIAGLAFRVLFGFILVGVVAASLLFWQYQKKVVLLETFDGFDGTFQESQTLYISQGSIYSTFFKEPFETVVFIFPDGSFSSYSTHDDGKISASINTIVESLEKSGKRIVDCEKVVHNHFTPIGFTEADKRTYGFLKAKGFHGVFAIYYTVTGKFLILEK
jgi:hypothetical protein